MSHINTLKLHQLRLGELGPEEAGQLRVHLAECALCASRAQHQAATRAAFLQEPMPPALEPQPSLLDRLRAWLFPLAVLVPATLAAMFVMQTGPAPGIVPSAPTTPEAPIVAPKPEASLPGSPTPAPNDARPVSVPASSPAVAPTPSPTPDVALATPFDGGVDPAHDVTHPKGLQTRLEAWVQSGQSSRPLYLGETVSAGTRVQLRYDPQGRRYVTLAGRDSNGVVEVYGTVPGGDSGALQSAPFALTLDDSRGEQAFFALCTNTRPSADEVVAAVKHNPVRMDGAVVASVVVRKD